MFAEGFDEKAFVLIEQRVIDGGSAEIDTGHDRHGRLLGSDSKGTG